jgi:hypothetical protein
MHGERKHKDKKCKTSPTPPFLGISDLEIFSLLVGEREEKGREEKGEERRSKE